jgi:hypothetical protein
MAICARDSIWKTPTVSARRASRRLPGLRVGRPACEGPTRSSARMDRREHAEGQDVDLQQPERVEIVLVPLDHRALRHRGVFHRHQAVASGPREMTKPPTCCERWRGKPTQGARQCQPFGDARSAGSRPTSRRRSGSCSRLSHQASEGGQRVDLGQLPKPSARPASRSAPRVR